MPMHEEEKPREILAGIELISVGPDIPKRKMLGTSRALPEDPFENLYSPGGILEPPLSMKIMSQMGQ